MSEYKNHVFSIDESHKSKPEISEIIAQKGIGNQTQKHNKRISFERSGNDALKLALMLGEVVGSDNVTIHDTVLNARDAGDLPPLAKAPTKRER